MESSAIMRVTVLTMGVRVLVGGRAWFGAYINKELGERRDCHIDRIEKEDLLCRFGNPTIELTRGKYDGYYSRFYSFCFVKRPA